jgi:hypothetical protein
MIEPSINNYRPPPAQAHAQPAQAQAHAHPPPPPRNEDDDLLGGGGGLVWFVILLVKLVRLPIALVENVCMPDTIDAAKSAPGSVGIEIVVFPLPEGALVDADGAGR